MGYLTAGEIAQKLRAALLHEKEFESKYRQILTEDLSDTKYECHKAEGIYLRGYIDGLQTVLALTKGTEMPDKTVEHEEFLKQFE